MSKDPQRVLILDDERPVQELLYDIFLDAGYECHAAGNGKDGLELFRVRRPDVTVVDVKMPVADGREFLKAARALDPDAAIIMLTGIADIKTAIECLKQGAADFILKPVDVDEILIAAERALERRQLLIERRQHEAMLERKVEEATRELAHLAQHDPLTGLANRSLFQDRLTGALTRADRNQQLVALMFLDLDRFKAVNDTLGHDAGDLLLKVVADRLHGCLRKADTLSRWGGDEFTVILEGLAHAEDAAMVAQKILEVIAEPIVLGGQEIFVTVSIGVAIYPRSGADAETLTKNADAALFRAKDQGGNTSQFYAEEMDVEPFARLALRSSLHQALEREEFVLYYQPQLDLQTGRIVGVEALLRWQHPERGLIRPAQFLPAAEESGQIVPIGEWVLHQACGQAQAWREAGLPPLRMAVNLSARQFRQKTLVASVGRALKDTGLDPQYLELELTERHLVEHARVSSATLAELRAMGLHIAIDDFGTGYSSLSYLRRFPIEKLKIDQSFVAGVTTDPNAASVATAVIALAHSLGLRVIAEGVETGAQRAFLQSQGCDEIQGDLFSPPMPAGAFAQFLGGQRQAAGYDPRSCPRP